MRDATFVHDEAFILYAKSPRLLNKAIRTTLTTVSCVFRRYNMFLNWSRGKSEVMISYRGKHSKAVQQELVQPDGSLALRVHGLNKLISVVDSYKHVGSFVDCSAGLFKEARHRSNAGMSAYAPIATRVFGSSAISVKRRIALGTSLVIS